MTGENLRRRALLPWTTIVLLLVFGPYLFAWAMTPDGSVFTGTLANHNDLSAYLSAVRQGAEGKWLYHFYFSAERWQPHLMLPLYILLGKLMGIFGGTPEFWFHAARLPAVLAVMYALFLWLREIFPGRADLQRSSLVLILFAGGVSWLVWPLTARWNVPFSYFPDISKPEWSFLLIAYNAPHYLLGLALEVALFMAVLRWARSPWEGRWVVVATMLLVLLGVTYVYNLAVALAIIGVYFLVDPLTRGNNLRRQWLVFGLFLFPALLLLYTYVWASSDPVWAEYTGSSVNHTDPPPPLGLAIGLGIPGVLAAIGSWRWVRSNGNLLVPTWLVVNLILMYVPGVGHAGRFALGLIVPIGTLAAVGLEDVFLPWLRQRRFSSSFSPRMRATNGSMRRITILFSLPSALMIVLLMVQSVAVRRDFPNYMPLSERAAASWLAEHTTEEDLILAYYPMGNYLPVVANSRVFLGQFFLTPRFETRLEQVEKYWDENTSDAWRRALIREWGVTYVYAGKYEREIMVGSVEPEGDIVYREGDVAIYRVPEEGTAELRRESRSEGGEGGTRVSKAARTLPTAA